MVAQLFYLHEGLKTVARTCATVMVCGGIVMNFIAAWRYLSQSRALLGLEPLRVLSDRDLRFYRRGGRRPKPTGSTSLTGALYVLVSGSMVGVVCIGLFVLLLATG